MVVGGPPVAARALHTYTAIHVFASMAETASDSVLVGLCLRTVCLLHGQGLRGTVVKKGAMPALRHYTASTAAAGLLVVGHWVIARCQ